MNRSGLLQRRRLSPPSNAATGAGASAPVTSRGRHASSGPSGASCCAAVGLSTAPAGGAIASASFAGSPECSSGLVTFARGPSTAAADVLVCVPFDVLDPDPSKYSTTPTATNTTRTSATIAAIRPLLLPSSGTGAYGAGRHRIAGHAIDEERSAGFAMRAGGS